MGYAYYEDGTARSYGVERWAGYGVPAICDRPDCDNTIDRGMDYRCDEYTIYGVDPDTEDETETQKEGCGLFFCPTHQEHGSGHGTDVTPKPDTAEWNNELLTNEGWAAWRKENPAHVAAITGASAR